MKVVFLAAVASLLVLAVSASEDEEQELIQQSKSFMDNYYKGVIEELKVLKASGKTYNSQDLTALLSVLSAEEFAMHEEESKGLIKQVMELEEAGKVRDFKIHVHGSPEMKKELGQAAVDLLKGGELAPRFFGPLVVGLTLVATDTVRLGTTRSGKMPDSLKV